VKRLLRRSEASEDVENAVLYYLEHAEPEVAERFLNEYDDALLHITQFPGTGSGRYTSLLSADGLRFWTLHKFPYAVFYLEHANTIEIIRVLHQSSDIPAHLQP
jgi:toxin ParE1/3/4